MTDVMVSCTRPAGRVHVGHILGAPPKQSSPERSTAGNI